MFNYTSEEFKKEAMADKETMEREILGSYGDLSTRLVLDASLPSL